ncbi:ubiquitin-specific cysteine protease, OTU family, Otu1 [Schizosaccharomyces osmophilus]|uniref:Ubiquitin thioesterase OTU n=1 Tax=Schizosaccharomyces osmophilus TaxID=2545709 RepID=A0AAE9WAF1_9SCHI|nr:ubiquitin-specific cysteine protease, OTU family, Otu1 [Schizosaccharomyces osmophilus]WBW71796.1 ubiquitin-specific cysteine protease, OTU family, Otu1 [Schizosaccharomyces osmophilus]
MSNLRLRLKYMDKSSVATIPNDASVQSFLETAAATFSLAPDSISIKLGFPPKDLPLNDMGSPISSLISSGQQILVVKSPSATKNQVTPAPSIPQAVSKPTESSSNASTMPSTRNSTSGSQDPPYVNTPLGDMALRVMPDDNSCLFRALSKPLGFSPYDLREVVASTILSNPELYSTAVLGKPPIEYAAWIRKESSWGGYIELSVLSSHFDLEICSVDVQTGRVDSYNPQPATGQRTFIVYSGIHYDLAALASVLWDTDADIVLFDASDDTTLPYIQQLSSYLKNMHYYTDTASFTIRCNTCGAGLVGEKDASAHAMTTGHVQFGEY